MKGNKIVCFLIMLILFSCKSELGSKAYLNYLQSPSNGLNQTVSVDSKDFNAQLITNDWFVIKENAIDNYIMNDEIAFVFSITTKNGDNPLESNSEDESSYYEKLALFNQQSKDIFLIEDNDGNEFLPLFSQVEMGYDVSSYVRVMLTFNKPTKSEDFKLVFNDIIWNNGPIKLTFKTDDIQKIPSLTKSDYDSKD